MKKFILCVLLIYLLVLSVSCDRRYYGNSVGAQQSSNETNHIQETGDELPDQDVPVAIPIDSLEQLYGLLSSSKAGREQFNAYKAEHYPSLLFYYEDAVSAETVISKFDFPILKSEARVDFGGTYYVEEKVLHLCYIVDDITYRFIYRLENIPLVTGEKAVFSDVSIGSKKIDLYREKNYYVGIMQADEYEVKVMVFMDERSEISFDIFEFKSLSELVTK